jgi:hypothetical protein
MWWTKGERDDVFWRSAGSGAMAKTRSKVGKSTYGQYGDIQAVDPIGEPLLSVFTIEIKRGYSKFMFMDMVDKPEKAGEQEWEKWHDQVTTDSKNAGSPFWWLITRRDRRMPLIFLPGRAWNILKEAGLGQKGPWLMARVILKSGKRAWVGGMLLNDFLDQISPDDIKRLR